MEDDHHRTPVESTLDEFMQEICRRLDAFAHEPKGVEVLKHLGRFALSKLGKTPPDWAKEYQTRFNEADP